MDGSSSVPSTAGPARCTRSGSSASRPRAAAASPPASTTRPTPSSPASKRSKAAATAFPSPVMATPASPTAARSGTGTTAGLKVSGAVTAVLVSAIAVETGIDDDMTGKLFAQPTRPLEDPMAHGIGLRIWARRVSGVVPPAGGGATTDGKRSGDGSCLPGR